VESLCFVYSRSDQLMPPIGETGIHFRRRPPLLQVGPVRRFGVTQQSHHLAYDIQLWWRLGGSGLEFAITRQRRIKKFSQRSSAVIDLFAHGSILVIVRRSQRVRLTICMVKTYPPGPCGSGRRLRRSLGATVSLPSECLHEVGCLKEGNDNSICQPSECHVLRPLCSLFDQAGP